jgi:hypothetical protein
VGSRDHDFERATNFLNLDSSRFGVAMRSLRVDLVHAVESAEKTEQEGPLEDESGWGRMRWVRERGRGIWELCHPVTVSRRASQSRFELLRKANTTFLDQLILLSDQLIH